MDFLAIKSDKKESETIIEKVIAICPKCGIEHEVEIHWTGSGIPKVYCSIHNWMRFRIDERRVI
jgi:hypothetical protein